jgi:hypothetical protein
MIVAKQTANAGRSLALTQIAPLIHEVRGERVILDSDLARIYGVSTSRLNEQLKRNLDRFPKDFAFRLKLSEMKSLMSHFARSSLTHGGRRKLPYVFTEHGAIMAANVLKTREAVRMSVFVVRAFVRLRQTVATHRELTTQVDELERKVGRHDQAIAAIIKALRELAEPPKRERRPIGFR